jgi:hypothetical protein
MNDRQYDNFIPLLIHLIDDNVRIFDQLTSPLNQARTPHIGETVFSPSYTKAFRSEAVAPILNKVGQFTASPELRLILGQVAPCLDLGFTMNNRRILVANLAKGAIGEQAANLLGSLLVSHLQLIAMSRATLAPVSAFRSLCMSMSFRRSAPTHSRCCFRRPASSRRTSRSRTSTRISSRILCALP